MSDKLLGVLAESDDRYRSVIAAMSEGVVLLGADSAILACNESAERLLGLSAEQMAGRSPYDPRWRSVHTDGSPFPGEIHPVVRALRSGLPERDVEMGVHKPDGTLTWISINAQPLFRADDNKPYAVVATFADVTVRKQAEFELQESEDRYRRIVETSVEGIWLIDIDGHTAFANDRMARMLRCTREELSRSCLWDFVEPEQRGNVEQRLQQRGRGVDEEHEFCFLAKDGTRVWTSLSACATALPDGRPGALAMVRDVTQQKHLVEELHEARRLEAVGRLAGGIAHDFNNLLTAILTSVTLAERSAHGESRYLEVIRTASERAAVLTRQLLEFARKQPIELKPLFVEQVVSSALSVLSRVGGAHVEIVLEFASDARTILGDAGQIEQMLINLVAYARDAMPGGGRVQITTSPVRVEAAQHPKSHVVPGDYVLLSVWDTGPGIDEFTRQHLFEPFFTTKGHGAGLGLASCYGIVKQLNGHILVRNARSGGTRFDIYLPACGEQPTKAEAPRAKKNKGGRETILIAEDDRLVRDSLRRALREHGYIVIEAHDGEHALAVAAEHTGPIDLLITDVVMPKLGGPQLCERLRALRPGLPTLFVSGYSEQAVRSEERKGAPSRFLTKPYSLTALARNVRELIDSASENRAPQA